jgi:uncharacterized protein (TIGR00730 family)
MSFVHSLCVYCGSSGRGAAGHRRAAQRLGGELARRRIRLVYGGGMVGLMGLVADAALKEGGTVVGVIPRHLDQQEIGHRGLTELVVCDSMHARKQRMFELADAFAVLPGGYGTLDEAFEIITWRQLTLHDKPVFLVNVEGYWDPLVRLLNHVIEQNYAHPETASLYRVVEGVDGLFQAIEAEPEPQLPARAKWM